MIIHKKGWDIFRKCKNGLLFCRFFNTIGIDNRIKECNHLIQVLQDEKT